jgi:hypothetical protein
LTPTGKTESVVHTISNEGIQMIDQAQALNMVLFKRRVRIHSGAQGLQDVVIAEGRVVAYTSVPSLTIEHADGSRSTWPVTLPITEIEEV